MKIGIIGSGISGLVVAHHLFQKHDITVFEANDYIGGHTNTVEFELNGREYCVDTGFIVFNNKTYPNFLSLLGELDVAYQPTIMSFSVSCEETGLEYRGADFDGLFAQRRNILRPSHYKLLLEIVRFNKHAKALLEPGAESQETVGQFLQRNRFSNVFIKQYLLPMGSAVWSCPFEKFRNFPMQFIAEFFENHGLLNVRDRPQWYVVSGGSFEYVKTLSRPFRDRICLNSPVRKVERNSESVTVFQGDDSHEFDKVVFACHADQALRILGNSATEKETEILSAFPYEPNVATLHTQTDVLPRRRRAWASWNYFNPVGENTKATVTYNMNILQSIESDHVFNVTLNDDGRIESENVIQEFQYHHPTFDIRQKSMQKRHTELLCQNRTSFCGAYWGNGFHEDGVNSALAVVNAMDKIPVVEPHA